MKILAFKSGEIESCCPASKRRIEAEHFGSYNYPDGTWKILAYYYDWHNGGYYTMAADPTDIIFCPNCGAKTEVELNENTSSNIK